MDTKDRSRRNEAGLPVVAQFCLSLLFCLLLSTAAPLPIFAQADQFERIKNYHSHIIVNKDASVSVTETITVNARGSQIKRGIFRDLPTIYKRPNGTNYRIQFNVLGVKRNGQPENYAIESISGGKRIRIGSADKFLSHGQHTYEITYEMTRMVAFFEDFDELYWNVTGNFWEFTIDKASAEIYLPAGGRAYELNGNTGPMGAQGKDYTTSRTDTGAFFKTTRALSPGEGLTISVTWPKGIVDEPTAAEKRQAYLSDNLGIVIALLSVLGVSGYYFFSWSKFGRDPDGGAIFPRYEPPAGLSPAACRFIRRMGYDRKAFTSAIINMAVKGYLTIDETGKRFSLEVQPNADIDKLSPGEKKLASTLFSGSRSRLELKNKYHSTFSSAISKLKNTISNEYETGYFKRNTMLWIIGIGLSIVAVVVSAILSAHDPVPIFLAVWLSGWTVGCTVLGYQVIERWKQLLLVPGDTIGDFISAVFLTGFALPFFAAEIFVLGMFAVTGGIILGLIIVCLGALNFAFYHLMKAPTLAGKKLMDEIEGFRQYLSVTEKHRLNMTGPEKTPELYEKYLPYALALDVENEWSEQFADVLAAAATAPGSSGGYHPSWYHGNRWNNSGPSGFSSALGSSLSSSIASAATAPGSSSGSSGGGFSGGGGGGGGGGGW